MSQRDPKWQDGVSIIIPTYKRPHGISTALPSVASQKAGTRPVEIIVADNDPAGSAREYVESFAAKSSANICYVHVPQPGVSNARNGAINAAQGRFIAFLDDDMEALQGWLEPLINVAEKFGAGVVFGPIRATVPNDEDPLQALMVPIYSRDMNQPDGLLDEGIGTGNSLLDLDRCILPSPIFNPDMNQTGGEDDALFGYMQSKGVSFAWANEAKTLEHVPADRANMSYVWRRNFSWGQSPSQDAAGHGIKGVFSLSFWMLIGVAQAIIFGTLMCFYKLIKQPKYVTFWARFAQGLGKVFWWDSFTPKLYGN